MSLPLLALRADGAAPRAPGSLPKLKTGGGGEAVTVLKFDKDSRIAPAPTDFSFQAISEDQPTETADDRLRKLVTWFSLNKDGTAKFPEEQPGKNVTNFGALPTRMKKVWATKTEEQKKKNEMCNTMTWAMLEVSKERRDMYTKRWKEENALLIVTARANGVPVDQKKENSMLNDPTLVSFFELQKQVKQMKLLELESMRQELSVMRSIGRRDDEVCRDKAGETYDADLLKEVLEIAGEVPTLKRQDSEISHTASLSDTRGDSISDGESDASDESDAPEKFQSEPRAEFVTQEMKRELQPRNGKPEYRGKVRPAMDVLREPEYGPDDYRAPNRLNPPRFKPGDPFGSSNIAEGFGTRDYNEMIPQYIRDYFDGKTKGPPRPLTEEENNMMNYLQGRQKELNILKQQKAEDMRAKTAVRQAQTDLEEEEKRAEVLEDKKKKYEKEKELERMKEESNKSVDRIAIPKWDPYTRSLAVVEALEEILELQGNDELKDEIYKDVFTFLSNAKASVHVYRNYAFLGPSGVGKTMWAKAMGKLYKHVGLYLYGKVDETQASDYAAAFLGQTGIKTLSRLMGNLENITLIDEAYALTDMGSGSGEGASYGKDAISAIVKFMDDYKGSYMIIVAGYEDRMNESFFANNEGLSRRFRKKVVFRPYTGAELTQILKNFLKKRKKLDAWDPKVWKLLERVIDVSRESYDYYNEVLDRAEFVRKEAEKGVRYFGISMYDAVLRLGGYSKVDKEKALYHELYDQFFSKQAGAILEIGHGILDYMTFYEPSKENLGKYVWRFDMMQILAGRMTREQLKLARSDRESSAYKFLRIPIAKEKERDAAPSRKQLENKEDSASDEDEHSGFPFESIEKLARYRRKMAAERRQRTEEYRRKMGALDLEEAQKTPTNPPSFLRKESSYVL